MRSGFAFFALAVLGAGCLTAACGGDSGDTPAPAGGPGTIAPVASGSRHRAEAYVDQVEVTSPPGGPVTVRVLGQLPTPCHELKWSVGPPDATRHITIHVFSEVEADALCSQVTTPFDQLIDVGSVDAGAYQALVNGTAYAFTA